jgi:hypothetical protein
MTTIFISHKLINKFNEKLPELISNQEESEKVLEYIKETLRYDENQKKTGTYDKEKYQKYNKPYYEKNKEKINKQTAETRRRRKLEEQNSV